MRNSSNYIFSAVQEARFDFNNNPFNWTASEANARSKLYEILHRIVPGEIIINDTTPIPPFENLKSNRVYLELNIEKGIRPDIIIYKNGEIFNNNNDYKILDKIDIFIEVKATWGYHKQHFKGDGVLKDLDNLKLFPKKGYFVYFIANNFQSMTTGHINEYKTGLKNYLELKSRIYIVFRDIINPKELFE